jgi:DNA-binding transcriptional regulator YdaS (Cro superfamily)
MGSINPLFAKTAKDKKERRLAMLELAAPYNEKAFDYLGSYYAAAAFLTLSYPQVQKIKKAQDFFNVKSAMMIESISGGEITLKMLRPDLFFAAREIDQAIAEGKAAAARWAEEKGKPYKTGVLLND